MNGKWLSWNMLLYQVRRHCCLVKMGLLIVIVVYSDLVFERSEVQVRKYGENEGSVVWGFIHIMCYCVGKTVYALWRCYNCHVILQLTIRWHTRRNQILSFGKTDESIWLGWGREFNWLLAPRCVCQLVAFFTVLEKLCSMVLQGFLDTHSIFLLPSHFSHVSLCAMSY
jgi:hypothetical protein